MKPILLLLFLWTISAAPTQAKVVTLVASGTDTNEFEIMSGETAELIGWMAYQGGSMPYQLTVLKDNASINLYVPPSWTSGDSRFDGLAGASAKHVIAGPARIQLRRLVQ